MKISPISDSGLTVGSISADIPQSVAQKIRSLKMNTNANPGADTETPEVLPIPDTINDETPKVDEVTEPLSPQFAELARRRRALQVKEREIADREKALVEKSGTQPGGIDKARFKSDPLGVMLEEGVTYEQLTEAILASQNGVTPEIQALKAELRAMKEEVNKTLTDRDAKTEQEALAEMRKEATSLSAEGDDYELVRETGSIPEVMKLIERTYRETNEILDVREAMKLVEEQLIEDGLKIANIKKLRSRLEPELQQLPQQPQRQMRTLTNRDTASVPMSRKARALAAFAGTLKK